MQRGGDQWDFTKSLHELQLNKDQRLEVRFLYGVCVSLMSVCLHVLAKWALLAW